MSLAVDTDRITAGHRSDTYLAMRSLQGARTVYSTRVPLLDLDQILPLADPAHADPDNRKVDSHHTRAFGEYGTAHDPWVAPTLLARDNGGCRFHPLDSSNGTGGYLDVP